MHFSNSYLVNFPVECVHSWKKNRNVSRTQLIHTDNWESLAGDRSTWKNKLNHKGSRTYELKRTSEAQQKREQRKSRASRKINCCPCPLNSSLPNMFQIFPCQNRTQLQAIFELALTSGQVSVSFDTNTNIYAYLGSLCYAREFLPAHSVALFERTEARPVPSAR